MQHLRIVIAALLLTGGASSSSAEMLELVVGREVTELEISHCRTDSYQSGQLLIELSPELRTMMPLTAKTAILADHANRYSRRLAEISADFTHEKLANLQPAEMVAKMDEQAARTEALEVEMDALHPPYARSFGVATVDGSTIAFEGNDTRVIKGEQVEAFADLGGDVRVTARCESRAQ